MPVQDWVDTLSMLRALTQPASGNLPMSLLFELASMQPTPQEAPAPAESRMAIQPAPQPKAKGKANATARSLAKALQGAGFQVINEYENPSAWSTGGHLHVQWKKPQDRSKVAKLIQQIASGQNMGINIGGWGTGPPHRGWAHKAGQALDITVRGR